MSNLSSTKNKIFLCFKFTGFTERLYLRQKVIGSIAFPGNIWEVTTDLTESSFSFYSRALCAADIEQLASNYGWDLKSWSYTDVINMSNTTRTWLSRRRSSWRAVSLSVSESMSMKTRDFCFASHIWVGLGGAENPRGRVGQKKCVN